MKKTMSQILKAFAVTVAVLVSASGAFADDVIDIATFNIQQFGKAKMKKPDVVQQLVDIVRKYDLVAVQEVQDINQKATKKFLSKLGTGWAMLESPRTGQNPDDRHSQEQYVYYFNIDTIKALDSGVLYEDTCDQFQREPWLARFQAVGGNFTFVLINIHTKPTRAVEEISKLDDVIKWAQARPEWKSEDDFIALGDFNASCDYATDMELDALALSGNDYFWIVPHGADTNFAPGKCAYDRIVATIETQEDYAGSWGVDHNAFKSKEVSDHWPVWARFYIGKDSCGEIVGGNSLCNP